MIETTAYDFLLSHTVTISYKFMQSIFKVLIVINYRLVGLIFQV